LFLAARDPSQKGELQFDFPDGVCRGSDWADAIVARICQFAFPGR